MMEMQKSDKVIVGMFAALALLGVVHFVAPESAGGRVYAALTEHDDGAEDRGR